MLKFRKFYLSNKNLKIIFGCKDYFRVQDWFYDWFRNSKYFIVYKKMLPHIKAFTILDSVTSAMKFVSKGHNL